MTLLTLFYDISALQRFREDLGKIEQLRLIVPSLQVANIELVQEKIKVDSKLEHMKLKKR